MQATQSVNWDAIYKWKKSNAQDTNLSWYVHMANVDHAKVEGTATNTLNHSATTPRACFISNLEAHFFYWRGPLLISPSVNIVLHDPYLFWPLLYPLVVNRKQQTNWN